MTRNLTLYPWAQGLHELIFWQAVWFLYFQAIASAEMAILLMALYDIVVVVLEVPSGYFSDRYGRRITLAASALSAAVGCFFLYLGQGFAVLLLGQVLMGLSKALKSGTDSAMLYDTLVALGRQEEVARHELIAYRFRYSALAFSAVSGGLLAQFEMGLVYLVTACAMAASMTVTLFMQEPPTKANQDEAEAPKEQAILVLSKLRDPVLLWVFVSAIVAYTMSHVPFIFGQPYVDLTLDIIGYTGNTPVAMGTLITAMMLLSLAASFLAPTIRDRFGPPGCFFFGHGVQCLLVGAMAFIVHPLVVIFMVIRMVPDAFMQPYRLELIQPRLGRGYRATYLSVQSQTASLVFSATLFIAGWSVPSDLSTLARADLMPILAVYFWASILALVLFIGTAGVLKFRDNDKGVG